MQEFLVDSVGSGYPAVVQRVRQMVSSLRATVEPGARMEPIAGDPNGKSQNSNSLDDEDSDLDSRACQAGQLKQESRIKSVVHASWDDYPDCQIAALKPLPDFCIVDLSLRVEPSWMLGLTVSIMGRSLLPLLMVLRSQRPILTPWNQLLLMLRFLEKKFCRTQMTW